MTIVGSKGFRKKKVHLCPKKGPETSRKNSKFSTFFGSVTLRNYFMVQWTQSERKELAQKNQKQDFSKEKQLERLFRHFKLYLFLGLNLNLHLFFQLSSFTNQCAITDFPNSPKNVFGHFRTFPTKQRCLFWQNETFSLPVHRGWGSC